MNQVPEDTTQCKLTVPTSGQAFHLSRVTCFIPIKNQAIRPSFHFYCDPGETRTLDPLIKSQLLYLPGSYGVDFTTNSLPAKLVSLFCRNNKKPGH